MAGIKNVREYDNESTNPYRSPDPLRFPLTARQKYPQFALKWTNENSIRLEGWRGWVVLEMDPGDPERAFSPDGRWRVGDSFLVGKPKETAKREKEQEILRSKRRREAVERGAMVAQEMSKIRGAQLETRGFVEDGIKADLEPVAAPIARKSAKQLDQEDEQREEEAEFLSQELHKIQEELVSEDSDES